MEFYPRFVPNILLICRQFQFPTGWNSTLAKAQEVRKGAVSIPNGMEFYRARENKKRASRWFQFPTGWNSTQNADRDEDNTRSFNSQRDGILHDFANRRGGLYGVSIPNGMEFYAMQNVAIAMLISFNSQRDGILPPHFV